MRNIQNYFIHITGFLLFFLITQFLLPPMVHAELPDQLDPHEAFTRAKILHVVAEDTDNQFGEKTYTERLLVQFLEGNSRGKTATIDYTSDASYGVKNRLAVNDIVIVDSKPLPSGKMFSVIYQPYRINKLWWIVGFFGGLVLLVIGKKGIGAIIGLALSFLIIFAYIIPSILKGQDALTTCIIGSIIILFVTTYIAHGISLKTTVALVSTAVSLIIAAILSFISIYSLFLLGVGDENSYALQLGTAHIINPQGILLGGIIIGTLGALNDVTTTQAVTIFTLAKENPKQKLSHLFWKGMHIGREHIISMINTLMLAYAGSSFIVLLYLVFNPATLPWWLLINDPATIEEIIRAIIGSSALILAVPVTTLLASWISLHGKNISLHTDS